MASSVSEGLRPPQVRMIAFSAAGGGFGGALLAIIVAKILQGPCCCCAAPAAEVADLNAALDRAVPTIEVAGPIRHL